MGIKQECFAQLWCYGNNGVTFWCDEFINLHRKVELERPIQPWRSMLSHIFTVGFTKFFYAKIYRFLHHCLTNYTKNKVIFAPRRLSKSDLEFLVKPYTRVSNIRNIQ